MAGAHPTMFSDSRGNLGSATEFLVYHFQTPRFVISSFMVSEIRLGWRASPGLVHPVIWLLSRALTGESSWVTRCDSQGDSQT